MRTLHESEQDLEPEQRAELRRMLTQQAKRLLDLVENLLDLSRPEADSIRITPTQIDVAERLRTIIDAAVANGVTLDARADLKAPTTRRDASCVTATALLPSAAFA